MPGTRRGSATAGVRQDALRRENLGLLLRHLHLAGAASRSALVDLTGLNRSTIGALAAALADAGLVAEQVPSLTTSVGRPSLVLVPESQRVLVAAVEVTRTDVTVATVGLGGAVLERRCAALDEPSPQQVVSVTTALVGEVLAAAGAEARSAGVGVAVPGLVRAPDGLVRVAPNLGWREVPLGDLLAASLPDAGPAVVANEADLGARAEHLRGAARGCSDVVYLSAQVGLGAGVITAGHPLGGRGGYAGEVGHVVLDPLGRPCHCGSRGCWETEVNEEALLGHLPPGPGGPAAVAEVVAAAQTGDATAQRVLERVGDRLGQGLAGLINVLNPEVVVVGGHLAVVLPAVHERVEAVLATAALAAPREQVRLVGPALGADSALLGAAELAFTPLLEDPLGGLTRLPAAG